MAEPAEDIATEKHEPHWSEDRRLLGALALVILALYTWHAAQFGTWVDDDAGITFAYARNLVEGNGLVFSQGDPPVEGYSNPTWMLMMALTMAIGLFDLEWTPRLIGGLFGAATMGLSVRIVGQLTAERTNIYHLLPMGFLASLTPFVAWAISGLENGIYGFFIALATTLYLDDVNEPERPPRSGPVWLLVALSRPEAIMYPVVALIEAAGRTVWRGSWRWLAILYASFLLPTMVYVAWHLWVFDALLPNTYLAKIPAGSVLHRFTRLHGEGWSYVFDAWTTWDVWWMAAITFVALTSRALFERGLLLVWGTFAASIFFAVYSGGDWMMQFRLLTPMWLALVVSATVGFVRARHWLAEKRPANAKWATPGLAVIGVLATVHNTPSQTGEASARPTVPIHLPTRLYERLLAVTEGLGVEQPTLGMWDVGGPGYHAVGRARIIDLRGLAHRPIAQLFHENAPRDEWCDLIFGDDKDLPDGLELAINSDNLWDLAHCPGFTDNYIDLDNPGPIEARPALYINRWLVERPWSKKAAKETVHSDGKLHVHRLAIETGDDQESWMVAEFSLAEVPKQPVTLDIRLGAGPDAPTHAMTLLPALDPNILRNDRVYVHREPVPTGVDSQVRLSLGASFEAGPSPVPRRPDDFLPPLDGEPYRVELDEPSRAGVPQGMSRPYGKASLAAVTAQLDNRSRGLHFAVTSLGSNGVCTSAFQVGREVRLRTRYRVPNLDRDTERARWNMAVVVNWTDAKGKRVKSEQPFDADSTLRRIDWYVLERDIDVPEGMTHAKVCWRLFNATGTVEVDWVEIWGPGAGKSEAPSPGNDDSEPGEDDEVPPEGPQLTLFATHELDDAREDGNLAPYLAVFSKGADGKPIGHAKLTKLTDSARGLRFVNEESGNSRVCTDGLALPESGAIELRYRLAEFDETGDRWTPGLQSFVSWNDANGRPLRPKDCPPAALGVIETAGGWLKQRRRFKRPDCAAAGELCHRFVEGHGTFDLDWVKVYTDAP